MCSKVFLRSRANFAHYKTAWTNWRKMLSPEVFWHPHPSVFDKNKYSGAELSMGCVDPRAGLIWVGLGLGRWNGPTDNVAVQWNLARHLQHINQRACKLPVPDSGECRETFQWWTTSLVELAVTASNKCRQYASPDRFSAFLPESQLP